MALVITQQPSPSSSHAGPIGPGPTEEDSFLDQVDHTYKEVELPPGFPKILTSSLAWSGSLLESQQYIYHVTEGDNVEVHRALVSFKGAKYPPSF